MAGKIRPEQLGTAAAITALLNATDAAAARTALGLGALATQSSLTAGYFNVTTACENLLFNGSFEVDSSGDGIADNWLVTTPGVTGLTTSLVSSSVDLLGLAQRADFTLAGGSYFFEFTNNGTYRAKVVAGRPIRLSVWVRGSTTNRAIIYVEFYDAAGVVTPGTLNGTPQYMTATATQLKVGGTVPATAATARVVLRVLAESGTATTPWVEWDLAMLAHSDTYPEYSDSPLRGITPSADMRAFLATANDAAARTELGLGGMATKSAVAYSDLSATIGGRNLVPNSSFEQALTGWSATAVDSYAVSTAQALVGSQSLKLVETTAGAETYVTMTLSIRANTSYVFSAWLYVESITAGAIANRSILAVDSGGVAVNDLSLTSSHPTGVWTRKVLRITTGASATTLTVRLYCPQGTVYWDCVQVEEGDVPTAWSPADNEDTALVADTTTRSAPVNGTAWVELEEGMGEGFISLSGPGSVGTGYEQNARVRARIGGVDYYTTMSKV